MREVREREQGACELKAMISRLARAKTK